MIKAKYYIWLSANLKRIVSKNINENPKQINYEKNNLPFNFSFIMFINE